MVKVLPRNKEFEVKELRAEIERLKALVEDLRQENAMLEERGWHAEPEGEA